MSLDGFTAGRDTTQENPLGINGHLLYEWLSPKKQKEDEELASDTFKNCGAVILGSRTYLTAINGVWESKSPFPAPAIVLSTQKLNVIKGFSVVNGGIDVALPQAKSISNGKGIWVMGGVNVAQQFIEANLFDELHLHIAPVLPGTGTRLFEKHCKRKMEFIKTKVVETPGATHLYLKPISSATSTS